MDTKNETWLRVISLMPPRIATELRRIEKVPDEIRLSQRCPAASVTNGEVTLLSVSPTSDDISFVLRSLCSSSLYAHTQSICEGYVTGECGIRAGVVGKASMRDGAISAVTSVTSLVIRIPRSLPGASHKLTERLSESLFTESIILCAPPSGGKTTALRELVGEITSPPYNVPTSVVDTRCELVPNAKSACLAHLASYPRDKGMEIALRTLSPRVIVCDEIASKTDIDAVISCISSGVSVVASAHGKASSVSKSALYKTISAACKVTLCDVEKLDGSFDFRFYKIS